MNAVVWAAISHRCLTLTPIKITITLLQWRRLSYYIDDAGSLYKIHTSLWPVLPEHTSWYVGFGLLPAVYPTAVE